MTPAARFTSVAATSLAAVEPIVVTVTTVVCAASFGAFYAGFGWLPAVAGATVLGTVLGAVARRWTWWLTTLVTLAVLPVYTLYVAYHHETLYGLPGPAALRALGGGLMSGWVRMLTVALPADPTGDLIVLPIALTFLAALAGTLLASRTALVSALAVPPLLLFVTGLLFTAERTGSRLPLTAGVLLALLVLLLVRGNRVTAAAREGISESEAEAVGLDLAAQRWHSTLGRVAFGLPVVVVVTALAATAAPALPIADGSHRFDPRDYHRQQFRLAASLTPLARVKPQLETSPPVKLFTVRASQHGGSYPLDRIRVAALDSFDGALWTQSRDFTVVGSTLPEGQPLQRPVVTVDLDVDVARLPDPFLPVAGRPVRVGAEDVGFDTHNGTLVSTHPAVTGYRYQVTGEVRPLDRTLTKARVSQTAADQEYTRLPDPPQWLTDLADEVTASYHTPMTQLLAIEKYLTGQGYALSARPGHSYGAVFRTLQGTPEERAGYAEQFSSAFAMLARAKGYPARVAVGYRLSADKREGGVYQVDTSDAHAWPEVDLAGFGWVPFEPTNTKNAATSAPPRDRSAPVLPDDPRQQQPREPQAAGDKAKAIAGTGIKTRVVQAAIVAGGLMIGVLILLLAVVLAKLLRRARRARRGSPADRIAAAWQESTDRMRERGVRAPPTLTPGEVARECAFGPAAPVTDRATELALIVTTAVCAPYEPTDEAAVRAWDLEAEIRRALDRGAPVPVRLRMWLDPRPLLPRRFARARPPAEPVNPPPTPAPERVEELVGSGGT
jgi:transglutaminase-like putative cysteine protease